MLISEVTREPQQLWRACSSACMPGCVSHAPLTHIWLIFLVVAVYISDVINEA